MQWRRGLGFGREAAAAARRGSRGGGVVAARFIGTSKALGMRAQGAAAASRRAPAGLRVLVGHGKEKAPIGGAHLSVAERQRARFGPGKRELGREGDLGWNGSGKRKKGKEGESWAGLKTRREKGKLF